MKFVTLDGDISFHTNSLLVSFGETFNRGGEDLNLLIIEEDSSLLVLTVGVLLDEETVGSVMPLLSHLPFSNNADGDDLITDGDPLNEIVEADSFEISHADSSNKSGALPSLPHSLYFKAFSLEDCRK